MSETESKGDFFNEVKEEFKELGNKVNQMFDDFVRKDSAGIAVNVDVYETDDSYIFQADLPGMTKADVKLQVRDDQLTLKGERKRGETLGDVTFHKQERKFGEFRRSFSIPSGVDLEGIKAKFENGTLTITFPKSGSVSPDTEINID